MITEADTCRKYVLPRLLGASWEEPPHSFTEQRTFTDGRGVVTGSKARRGPQKRADYLLQYTQDFMLAVVEAKAAYKTPGTGGQLQQAQRKPSEAHLEALRARLDPGWEDMGMARSPVSSRGARRRKRGSWARVKILPARTGNFVEAWDSAPGKRILMWPGSPGGNPQLAAIARVVAHDELYRKTLKMAGSGT